MAAQDKKTEVEKKFETAFEEATSDSLYCSVGKTIATHDAGAVIKAKVEDVEHYSSTMISKVLRTLGVRLSADTISSHRKHVCRCPR